MRKVDWTISVPDGVRGPWRVSTFTVNKRDVLLENLRALRDGDAYRVIEPGTYRRLTCEGRGVIMSTTHMEQRTNYAAYLQARGRVLVSGLGLGMFLAAILRKPEVESVRVIEIEQDVIDLVGSTFSSDPRVTIVQGDALAYKPATGETYDFAWHDIWDAISGDNAEQMTNIKRKWSRRVPLQLCWSEYESRRENRRSAQWERDMREIRANRRAA